jgi:hypothetical protein
LGFNLYQRTSIYKDGFDLGSYRMAMSINGQDLISGGQFLNGLSPLRWGDSGSGGEAPPALIMDSQTMSERGHAIRRGFDLKKGLNLEPEYIGDDVAWEHLHLVFVLFGRIIVELAGKPDLILRIGQFLLQGKKVLIGLEIRIGLGHSKK